PMVRRAIRSQPVTMALVVGLGFSVGETLTPMIGKDLGYADPLPGTFNAFGWLWIVNPFGWFLHSALVALPFAAFARGGSFFLGGLAGMALHFLLTFPVLLEGPHHVFDVQGAVSALWAIGFVVACAVVTWLARPAPTD